MLADVFSLFWWTLCSIIFHLFNQFLGPEHFSFSYFPLLKNDENRSACSFSCPVVNFQKYQAKRKGNFFFQVLDLLYQIIQKLNFLETGLGAIQPSPASPYSDETIKLPSACLPQPVTGPLNTCKPDCFYVVMASWVPARIGARQPEAEDRGVGMLSAADSC